MIRTIAFIGGRDLHTLGGIENYTLNLSQRLVERGYEVVVYSESDHHECLREKGVKVITWKSFHNNLIDKPFCGFLSTLHAFFIEKHVDLFHYNAWGPSLSSWIPLLFGKKSLMQGHGLEWQRTKYSPFQQKIMKMMERITAHLNRNLIMVSQDQTDYFLKQYGRKAVTITPGISIPDCGAIEKENELLQSLDLEKEKFFLYLGRLVQDKNPDVLIQAFLKLNPLHYKLVIAGDNPAAPDYVAYLKQLGHDCKNIIFTGAVFGNKKNALLKNTLAYCIPSTLEGLPISLLEAMSWSRYCIASDIPGCREALGDAGIFVPLDQLCDGFADKMDAFIRAREDGVSAKMECPQNKKRVSQFFSWDIITYQYIEYIEHLKEVL